MSAGFSWNQRNTGGHTLRLRAIALALRGPPLQCIRQLISIFQQPAKLIVDLQPELNLAVLKKRTGNRPKRSGVEKPIWLV